MLLIEHGSETCHVYMNELFKFLDQTLLTCCSKSIANKIVMCNLVFYEFLINMLRFSYWAKVCMSVVHRYICSLLLRMNICIIICSIPEILFFLVSHHMRFRSECSTIWLESQYFCGASIIVTTED